MRHSQRRNTPMLQWNSKITALIVFAVLVAMAAVNGIGFFLSLNFTW
jgi:hypothetical protein